MTNHCCESSKCHKTSESATECKKAEVESIPVCPATAINIVGDDAGSILKVVVKEVEGPQNGYPAGSKATIHFKVFGPDRKLLDNTKFPGFEPLEIRTGKKFCVVAFDPIINSMKPGEISRFYCDEKNSEGYCQL
eukprot:Sdes_comp15664_c0_seq2m4681